MLTSIGSVILLSLTIGLPSYLQHRAPSEEAAELVNRLVVGSGVVLVFIISACGL